MYRLDTDLKINEQYKCFTNFNVHANHMVYFSLLDHSCPTLCSPIDCSPPARLPCPSLSFWSLLKPMSIESVMPSGYLILCHPVLLPSIFHSIRIFSNGLALRIRWPKYWNFGFSISPSVNIQD